MTAQRAFSTTRPLPFALLLGVLATIAMLFAFEAHAVDDSNSITMPAAVVTHLGTGQPDDLLATLDTAVAQAHWLLALAIALVLVLWVAVQAPKLLPIPERLELALETDVWRARLAWIAGTGSVVVLGLGAGKPLSPGLIVAGVMASASAQGLWSGGRKAVGIGAGGSAK